MNCNRCGRALNNSGGKIGFRDYCPNCNHSLHCCKNCKFYAVGRRNDCMIPATDYIADKEAANFCEEFQWIQKNQTQTVIDPKASFDRFFKDK